MKRLCTTFATLLLLASCQLCPAQDLQVREFRRVVDPRNTTSTDKMVWYAGESVGYTILSQRGAAAVEIPDGSVLVWQVIDSANVAYVVASGNVENATSGEVRFFLPAPEANLPAGSYISWATAYQGTNRVGVLDRATVEVRWRPGDDYTAVEPLSNVLDQVVSWWADANANLSAASNSLSARISLEETNRASAVGTVQTNLNTASNALYSAGTNEAALRISGDSSLASRIGMEETNRASAVGTVQTNLNTASNALYSAGTNEAALRISGDSSLANRIGLEETNRASAVGTVQTNLNTASNALYSAGTNEAALRVSGDSSLANRIGLEETNRASAVGTVQTNLNTASNALYSAGTNEAALRVSGDSSLANRIGLEETNRTLAVATVQSNLTTASNTLYAAGTNEAALRISGDSSLASRIGLEETNRTLAVATVQSNLTTASNTLYAAGTNEAALRISGDSSLSNRIGLEETNRASAVGTVQTNLNTASNALYAAGTNEAALRISGDSSLASRIGLEETNRTIAVATVQTNLNTASNSLKIAVGTVQSNLNLAVSSLASTGYVHDAIAALPPIPTNDFASVDYVDASVASRVPSNRTITINGITRTLSANASFTVEGGGDGTNSADMTGVARYTELISLGDAYETPLTNAVDVVDGTPIVLTGLTNGAIRLRITTTNAEHAADGGISISDASSNSLAIFQPACDCSEQTVDIPFYSGDTLLLMHSGLLPSLSTNEQPTTITDLRIWTAADPELIGSESDFLGQVLLVDDPEQDRQVANKRYADRVGALAVATANAETQSRTFDTTFNEHELAFGSRFSIREEGENLNLYYGGVLFYTWAGGGTVIPRITSTSIHTNGTVTLVATARTNGLFEVNWSTNFDTWTRIETNAITQAVASDKAISLTFTNPAPDALTLFFSVLSVAAPTTTPRARSIATATSGETDDPLATQAYVAAYVATNSGSGGGGTPTTNAFAGLPSLMVSADWTWTNQIYAVGVDTSTTNISITLPDAGTNFTSIVIRKFSNLNQLFVKRGTNVVYTLNDDGSARAYDWWPTRTNWYWRN